MRNRFVLFPCIFLSIWMIGICFAATSAPVAEAQRGSVPRECHTLAETSDYGTIIGPSIAALEAFSHQLGTVDFRCPDNQGDADQDRGCREARDACYAFYEANAHDGSYGMIIERFGNMSTLVSRSVGSHHFETPADWTGPTFPLNGPSSGMLNNDCMFVSRLADRQARLDSVANFLRQSERTYQQWWDWVRGLCHMTR